MPKAYHWNNHLNGDEDKNNNKYGFSIIPRSEVWQTCCFLNKRIFWLFHEKDPQKYEGPLMNEPSFLWQSPELKKQPSQNVYRHYKHIWNSHYGLFIGMYIEYWWGNSVNN